MKFRLKSMPARRARIETPFGTVIFVDGIADVKLKPTQEFLMTLGHVEKVEAPRKKNDGNAVKTGETEPGPALPAEPQTDK